MDEHQGPTPLSDPLRHAGPLRRMLSVVPAPTAHVSWSYPLRASASVTDEGLLSPRLEPEEFRGNMVARAAYVNARVVAERHTDTYAGAKLEEAEHAVWQKLEELLFFSRSGGGQIEGWSPWSGLVQYAEGFGRVATHHTIDQAAVDTAARNLTGERVTFWAPPGVVLDTPQRGSMHSLPLDVPVVVGVDLDLVEWAEACPPTWVELAQISERREAMLFTGGVLKLLDPMGVFVVKLGGGPWRSDFPAAGQWVLGFWRGRHVLCMWTRSPDGSRGWWLNGNMDDQLTASDGPDYWMPLPNAPDRRLPRFRPANP